MIRAERVQPRDEDIRIAATVWMMVPDEVPAIPPDPVHSDLFHPRHHRSAGQHRG
jgi:hypothetical protein